MQYFTPTTIVAMAVAGYALPSLVAVARGRRRQWGIVAVNLLLGWTLVGWLAAMVWAVQAQAAVPTAKRSVQRPATDDADGVVAPQRQAATRSRAATWDDERADDAYADWLATGESLAVAALTPRG